MAHTLTARIPFGPNVRIALVTGVSLALLGAVTIVLPFQRLSAVTTPQAAAGQSFPKFKTSHAATPAAPAKQGHDQLIAMTFDLLQALSKEPIAGDPQSFAPVTRVATAEPATAPSSEPTTSRPTTRVVRTTAIRVAPTTPDVVAPPEPIPEATAVASELDVDKGAAAEEVAAAVPTAAAPPATASGPNLRIVAGQGVNVRSGPGKSKEKLFALPGGAEVTISSNERGWLKITDAQGRTGWIYKDYLLRP
jgi:cytoskeletal protein RodZ